MTSVITWVAVFFAVVLMDYVWCLYVQAVATKRLVVASNMSVAIIGLSGYVTTMYIDDVWLLIPAGIGAWIGTAIAVKLQRN